MSVKHTEIAPWCHRRGESPLQPWQLPLPSRSLELAEMAKNHNKPPNQLCFSVRPFNPPLSQGAWQSPGCCELEFKMALLGQFWLHNVHSWSDPWKLSLSPWSCWLICSNPHFSLLKEDLWWHRKPNPGLSEEVTPAWRSRGSPKVPQRFPGSFLVSWGRPRALQGALEKDK